MSRAQRTSEEVELSSYAVLGDGRTVALVARDGRIDWWPVPTLDAPPVLAALLDPQRGGHCALAPTEEFESTRQYCPGSNVLETTFRTAQGVVRVTDALNTGSSGCLPWTELARRVEGVAGEVAMYWAFVPGDSFGTAIPRLRIHRDTTVASIGDRSIGVIIDRKSGVSVSADRVEGAFTIKQGERVLLALVATARAPLFIPEPAAIDQRLDRTLDSHQRWTASLDNHGEWSSSVERSVLALKTLIAEETGALAAAATTSLPESIGGPKNWDYRYAWIRDSSFVLDAFINLDLHQEVHGAMSWLLKALHRNGGELAVFFTLDGDIDKRCVELDLPGYRQSRPVRSGNTAAKQIQLGTYGDLFDAIYRYVGEGHVLDALTQQLLAELADDCCDRWREKDSGIWELAKHEHYTISKIGCWVALDRAVLLFESGELSGDADRWRDESSAIRRFVDEHCWSTEKGAYTFYADADKLDASVLLAGRTAYERGTRLSSTCDAIASELQVGALLYRYSGAAKEEGAFVACTFWMVEALVHCGRDEEARTLMEQASALGNDVGILAEQIDPATGQALGNLPQALSHVALINAVSAIRRSETTS